MKVIAKYIPSRFSILLVMLVVLISSGTVICGQGHGYIMEYTNHKTGSQVVIKQGNTLILAYQGYLHQLEYTKGRVQTISDTAIVLYTPGPGDKQMIKGTYPKTLLIRDISGLRKISSQRQYLKAGIEILGIVGGVFLYASLSQAGWSPFSSGLATAGTGLAFAFVVEQAFSEGIKYWLRDGGELNVYMTK